MIYSARRNTFMSVVVRRPLQLCKAQAVHGRSFFGYEALERFGILDRYSVVVVIEVAKDLPAGRAIFLDEVRPAHRLFVGIAGTI